VGVWALCAFLSGGPFGFPLVWGLVLGGWVFFFIFVGVVVGVRGGGFDVECAWGFLLGGGFFGVGLRVGVLGGGAWGGWVWVVVGGGWFGSFVSRIFILFFPSAFPNSFACLDQ